MIFHENTLHLRTEKLFWYNRNVTIFCLSNRIIRNLALFQSRSAINCPQTLEAKRE